MVNLTIALDRWKFVQKRQAFDDLKIKSEKTSGRALAALLHMILNKENKKHLRIYLRRWAIKTKLMNQKMIKVRMMLERLMLLNNK